MNAADLYTALMGGRYGPDQREPPFVAGHDGIGVVLKVYIPSETHRTLLCAQDAWSKGINKLELEVTDTGIRIDRGAHRSGRA